MVGIGYATLDEKQRSENMLKLLMMDSVIDASSRASIAAVDARVLLCSASFPSFARFAGTASNGMLPSVHFRSWIVIFGVFELAYQ